MVEEISTVPRKKSAVIKWMFVIAIAIVLNLFLTYAVDVVYDQPQYEDFCPVRQVVKEIDTQADCLEVGGQWNPNVSDKSVQDVSVPAGYCDQDFTCRQKFEDESGIYNRNLFVVFVIVGALALMASVFLTGAEAVSLGLSFGGVLSFIIGSVTYWSDMNDLLRVAILGLALVALIWLAYKKFKD